MKCDYFCFLVLMLSLVACNSKPAFLYSEMIVKKEISLVPDITETESSVARFVEAEQYDSVAIVSQRMESLVAQAIADVEKMPVPEAKGAEAFKTSSINYFAYFKKIYASYKNFGLAKTDDDREAEKKKMFDVLDLKKTEIIKMKEAQEKFALDNDFRLQTGN